MASEPARIPGRFTCRKRGQRGARRTTEAKPKTVWRDAVREELGRFAQVPVLDRVSIEQMAEALDEGGMTSAGMAQLEKRLRERVDQLERRQPKADDPAVAVKGAVERKRLTLVS